MVSIQDLSYVQSMNSFQIVKNSSYLGRGIWEGSFLQQFSLPSPYLSGLLLEVMGVGRIQYCPFCSLYPVIRSSCFFHIHTVQSELHPESGSLFLWPFFPRDLSPRNLHPEIIGPLFFPGQFGTYHPGFLPLRPNVFSCFHPKIQPIPIL